VSDIDMPGMTGLDLMRHARDACPGAVRMLLTGRASVGNATRAINDGEVHRFLHKPFEPRILRTIVAEAVDRHRELAAATDAGRRAERKKLLLTQLELEHPGVTRVVRSDCGDYVVDVHEARARAAAEGLGALFRT
jgi:FixJ family two-component response regulator